LRSKPENDLNEKTISQTAHESCDGQFHLTCAWILKQSLMFVTLDTEIGRITIVMLQQPLALHPPHPSIPIRPVCLTDVADLRANCWSTRPYMAVHNLIRQATRYAAQGRGQGLVVAGSGGGVFGYGQVLLWPTCAEISELVVAAALRSQGIGTALVQALVQRARALQAAEVEIGATLDNLRAVALYRRLGFEDSHTAALNFGQGQERVLFLRLALSEK
jgi:ribosomal protein S18 acetylase RimI-like enzyme